MLMPRLARPGWQVPTGKSRLARPDCAQERPVPAVLEPIPYRTRFGSASRDVLTHGYLAGHGYACLRVDIRGSGESEGVQTDEYLPQELEDGLAIIEWIATQVRRDSDIGVIVLVCGALIALGSVRPPIDEGQEEISECCFAHA